MNGGSGEQEWRGGNGVNEEEGRERRMSFTITSHTHEVSYVPETRIYTLPVACAVCVSTCSSEDKDLFTQWCHEASPPTGDKMQMSAQSQVIFDKVLWSGYKTSQV